uniref:Uncharacterized protein n=1 Tax=Klebsiella pneumoniae TaxID=573 RepID=A0A6M6A593_KLEPN|nr:hypothetical protein [Klebsiella pneumoniae]
MFNRSELNKCPSFPASLFELVPVAAGKGIIAYFPFFRRYNA